MRYLPAIEKGIHWIETQMLTFDGGFYGIYERIRIDAHIRTNWSRPDGNAEYLRVLATHRRMTGTDAYDTRRENLLRWLETTQALEKGSVWEGSLPFYLVDGYIREGKVDASVYQNDNGKVLLCLCDLHLAIADARALRVAVGLAEYWLATQNPDGTYGARDGRNMDELRKGPCFVLWLTAGLYRLYAITGEKRYLNSAEKGMAYLLTLLLPTGRILTSYEVLRAEDWRPVSSETAMMLLTLGIACQVAGSGVYREKLGAVAGYLLGLQHESGGIRNCAEDCLDASLQNDPELCDLVYTQGFALQALVQTFRITKDRAHLEAARRLGDFLASIQCSGESALWDGGWRGSYNLSKKRWEGRANQNNAIDEGGMYSVYTGWCCTNILYGFQLLAQSLEN
jgi:hypothetical protein